MLSSPAGSRSAPIAERGPLAAARGSGLSRSGPSWESESGISSVEAGSGSESSGGRLKLPVCRERRER